MEAKEIEVDEYLRSLGWRVYYGCDDSPKIQGWKMGDRSFGYAWYKMDVEKGFNEGTHYYITFKRDVNTEEPVSITFFESVYSSYSCPPSMNQYSLDNIKELQTLMRFKKII